jgi:hypothetical protein
MNITIEFGRGVYPENPPSAHNQNNQVQQSEGAYAWCRANKCTRASARARCYTYAGSMSIESITLSTMSCSIDTSPMVVSSKSSSLIKLAEASNDALHS